MGGGHLVLVEWLAGSPEQGVYLAASRTGDTSYPPGPPYCLISTALDLDASAAFRVRTLTALALVVPGVVPLHGLASVDPPVVPPERAPGAAQVPLPTLIGLVEACPSGVPSHRWPVELGPNEAISLALGVAYSLAAAHGAGLAVGGIRPEHVYISTAREEPALSGIAPRAERFWRMLPRPGFGIAPAYSDMYDAPEQLRPERRHLVTPAGDVFSLCATLVYWLTNRHPFAGKSPSEQAVAILEGHRAPPPPGADQLLRSQVIRRGLNADPEARPSIANVIDLLLTRAPEVKPAWSRNG